MAELEFPEWQQDYDGLLLETDEQRFAERLQAAEDAIASRIEDLRIGSDPCAEYLALERAIEALAILKQSIAL